MSLFRLVGKHVVPEPCDLAWTAWLKEADRTLQEVTSFTPTRVWKLTTYFMGVDVRQDTGSFYFASIYRQGPTVDLMVEVGKMVLTRTWAEAMAEHDRLRSRLLAQPRYRGTER